MSIDVWYHLFAAGKWQDATREFFDAAEVSGLLDQGYVHLGLVGSAEQRAEALAYCEGRGDVISVADAVDGAEQVTLNALWDCREMLDRPVLYAHSKGAAVVNEWNDAWRRSMYLCLVAEWRSCLPWLDDYEAVGCHWLLPTPGMPQRWPFFGGNCWIARASLIQRLGPPQMTSRYDAEAWVGSAPNVTAHDLTPGWPGWESIRQEARPKPPATVQL